MPLSLVGLGLEDLTQNLQMKIIAKISSLKTVHALANLSVHLIFQGEKLSCGHL